MDQFTGRVYREFNFLFAVKSFFTFSQLRIKHWKNGKKRVRGLIFPEHDVHCPPAYMTVRCRLKFYSAD